MCEMKRSENVRVAVQQTDHLPLGHEQDRRRRDRSRGFQPHRMTGQRAPRPEKSPGPSVATIASFPECDSTES